MVDFLEAHEVVREDLEDETSKSRTLKCRVFKSIDFSWHTDEDDNTPYIVDELIEVSEIEATAYADAANELYDMFVEAGDYIIKNNLFHEIGIPFNLVELIKESWESDVHWHLYGRFDLAGGIDGKPIKLLEFNADTPTALYETSIIQWALLKANNLDENIQFNNIAKAIGDHLNCVVGTGSREL